MSFDTFVKSAIKSHANALNPMFYPQKYEEKDGEGLLTMCIEYSASSRVCSEDVLLDMMASTLFTIDTCPLMKCIVVSKEPDSAVQTSDELFESAISINLKVCIRDLSPEAIQDLKNVISAGI